MKPLNKITTPVAKISPEAQREIDRALIRQANQVYIDNEGFDGEVDPPNTVEQARYILKMMGMLDN